MQQKTLEIQRSFTQLYSVYFARMIRFSQTYIINEEDSENIVQDIFLYLWEHPEAFHAINNPDAFLFTLVKNRCLNHIKQSLNNRKQPLENIEKQELEMNLYSLQQFDEMAMSPAEIDSLLNEAINKLPERCREIFFLSRMEGLKHKEIANRLNISSSTVENQIVIALQKLKIELKDYMPLFFFII